MITGIYKPNYWYCLLKKALINEFIAKNYFRIITTPRLTFESEKLVFLIRTIIVTQNVLDLVYVFNVEKNNDYQYWVPTILYVQVIESTSEPRSVSPKSSPNPHTDSGGTTLRKLINDYSKIAGYMVNIQNQSFFYISAMNSGIWN